MCADVISVGSDFSYTYFPFIVLAFRDLSSFPPSPRLRRAKENSFLSVHPCTVRNPVRGYAESAEALRTTDYAGVTDKRTLTNRRKRRQRRKAFWVRPKTVLVFLRCLLLK